MQVIRNFKPSFKEIAHRQYSTYVIVIQKNLIISKKPFLSRLIFYPRSSVQNFPLSVSAVIFWSGGKGIDDFSLGIKIIVA